jgi:cytochrome c553
MIFSSPAKLLAVVAVPGMIALLAHPGSSLAQLATARPTQGQDLRVLYADAADIADGKRAAEKACAMCHGANGISATEGVPHLAGQRPVYLYAEMKAYRAGMRASSAMRDAVQWLSDDALMKAAAYYASLDPPQPVRGAPAATRPDPMQAAKAASAACAGCHGESGVSTIPGMPSLAGMDPNYAVAAMKAYKTGERKSDVMKPLAAAIGDKDVANLALYYALQKPGRAQPPKGGDAAAGKAAAAACAGCHGDGGVASAAGMPSLAGQDPQYLVAALAAYKSGERKDETMKALIASLDDAGMRNLAAYYAAQTPRAPKVAKPLTTAEWIQRCDRCHGINGNSADPGLPAIAAQRVDYLSKVLHAYRSGERKSGQMAAMVAGLTEVDVEALAAHYARQSARAAVYVLPK